MKTRIITALLIIACVIPPLVFGGPLLDALVAFIIIGGGVELLALKENKDIPWPFIVKPIAIAFVFILTYLKTTELTIPLFGIFTLFFLSVSVFTERFHAKDGFLCISFVALFFLIARSFLNIYGANPMYVWFIIIATYACDTGAYFCGRFLGKHKMNPRISPKKTWEGAFGGWALGSIVSFAFAYFFIKEMPIGYALLASLVLTITGQIGDLVFSSIKRTFQIKDYSNLLPGHGGVLDRVDSLVFNFICFNLILVVLTL